MGALLLEAAHLSLPLLISDGDLLDLVLATQQAILSAESADALPHVIEFVFKLGVPVLEFRDVAMDEHLDAGFGLLGAVRLLHPEVMRFPGFDGPFISVPLGFREFRFEGADAPRTRRMEEIARTLTRPGGGVRGD